MLNHYVDLLKTINKGISETGNISNIQTGIFYGIIVIGKIVLSIAIVFFLFYLPYWGYFFPEHYIDKKRFVLSEMKGKIDDNIYSKEWEKLYTLESLLKLVYIACMVLLYIPIAIPIFLFVIDIIF